MNIQELKNKHGEIEGNTVKSLFWLYPEHTKLSIQFAIEMLLELSTSMETDMGQHDTWYTDKVEAKIEELKKYL